MATQSHDDIVRRLRAEVAAISPTQARDAFIASLSSAPLRFRSVLGHYAYAANFPDHRFEPTLGHHSYMCRECGLSAAEEVDEDEHEDRREDGSFLVSDPVAAMLDLEDFKATAKATPTAADFDVFDKMLTAIAKLPKKSRASALLKAWSFVKRTNKYSRDAMIATLGACGLLETIDHPGHLTRWVSHWEYEEVPSLSGEMKPPEAWWTASDGVNRAALDFLFKHKAINRTRFVARAWKRKIAKATSRAGNLTLSPGDRIGIQVHGRHLVGVVLGAHEGKIPVIEMYAGTWPAPPTEKELAKAGPRLVGPHRAAPTFRREPLALDGLELYGKVTTGVGFEVLARDCDPPTTKLPLPTYGYRVIAPRNMGYILHTLATS